MMQSERGRHFDPTVFDAFMEVLEKYGPDTRKQARANPEVLLNGTRDTYVAALARGDAETAESAIAVAVEDGIPPSTVHGQVIVPALRSVEEMLQSGELDGDGERLAQSITRRVLATLYRYMLGGTESTRERVLLAGLDGDEYAALELQMVHDQLAAAGYRTIFETDLSLEGLRAMVDSESPEVIILGGRLAGAESLEPVVLDLRARHPHLPIVLSGAAVADLPSKSAGMRALERIDESVETVEALLAARAPVPSL